MSSKVVTRGAPCEQLITQMYIFLVIIQCTLSQLSGDARMTLNGAELREIRRGMRARCVQRRARLSGDARGVELAWEITGEVSEAEAHALVSAHSLSVLC